MDKEQLDTFLSLVNYKNFTKSAEMLHVAQSTVSARLKSLELELGKTLLRRTNKGVELTPSGLIFLPYAKRIIELFAESKKRACFRWTVYRSISIGRAFVSMELHL